MPIDGPETSATRPREASRTLSAPSSAPTAATASGTVVSHHAGMATQQPAAGKMVLPVIAYGVLLLSALQTLVVPVIGEIGTTLNVSAATVSWVVTANLLSAAVLTPIFSRLGDLHGRRKILLIALVIVAVGSLLSASTSNFTLLLLGRVMQGASYAIFPLGIGILRTEVPGHRLTGAMAVVSGMLGVGAGVGLVGTGLLTRNGADYHRPLWLATGLVVLGLVAAWRWLPKRPAVGTGRVDWLGGGLLGAGLVGLLMPLSQGNHWGWGSPAVIGSLVASAAFFAAFLIVERRVTEPLVSPRMLTHRPILIANIAALFLGIDLFLGFLLVSQFVQVPTALAGYGFTSTVLAASVVYLLPGALSGVITAPLAGRLIVRSGAKATLVLSMLCALVGFGFMAAFHSSTWQLIVGSFLANTAVIVGYAALPALLVQHVTPAETGIANSVNSIARTVGSAVSSALITTMLTRNYIPGLPVAIPQVNQFVVTFVIGAIGSAIAIALLLTGLRRPSKSMAG